MRGARKLFVGAVAMSAFAGGGEDSLAGQGSAAQGEVTVAAVSIPRNSVGGALAVAVAEQTGERSRVKIHVALRDLRPDTTYRTVASTRRCSQFGGEEVQVWRWILHTSDGGASYKAMTLPRHGELTDVRSVRVEQVLDSGAVRQRACGNTSLYNSGTGVLTLARGRGAQSEVTRLSIGYPAGRGIRGIVLIKQRGRSSRARVNAMLTGLTAPRVNATSDAPPPSTPPLTELFFLMGGHPQTCSIVGAEAVLDGRAVFRSDASGATFVSRTVTVHGSIARFHSVRLYEMVSGRQRACGITSGPYNSGTGVLT
jgi:hypothetical protein